MVCLNEEQRRKDAADRQAIVAHLREELQRGDKTLIGNQGYRTYVLAGPGERFTINAAKLKEEARYDGKWVLRTNRADEPGGVAGAYKQLWMVEDLFRTMKSIVQTRPRLKMSDFGVDPPAVTTEQGPLTLAADELTVTVQWSALASVPPCSESEPLAVVFLGYTNGLGASVISNRCDRTVKVWAAAWVEAPPFEVKRSDKWIWVIGPRDRYLKPRETIYWTLVPPNTRGAWRLRIPWSEGFRAEIADWSRWHNVVGPGSVWAAPEYYAASEVITE